jgi:serine O-acetyltransferase
VSVSEDLRETVRAEESTAAAQVAGRAKLLSYVLLKSGVQAVLLYRLSRWCLEHRLRLFAYPIALISNYLTGADLPPTAQFGPGLMILHPTGVVVSGGVKGGARLRLHTGVVLGFQTAGKNERGVPELGDDVMIGVGAKVLGPVRIGDRVKIGANAVVLDDVPDDTSVVGVPARAVDSLNA